MALIGTFPWDKLRDEIKSFGKFSILFPYKIA